jgi:hypothetical protein
VKKYFHKEVTERPRTGGFGGKSYKPKGYYRKFYKMLKEDENDHLSLPKMESMSGNRKHGYNSKEFSDLIGPVKRWLRKQVGRRWDDIWSEICQQFSGDSVQGSHIRDHFQWEVWTKDSNYPFRGGLYVDDEGILQYHQNKARKRYKDWENKQVKYTPIQCKNIDGVWYECHLRVTTQTKMMFSVFTEQCILGTNNKYPHERKLYWGRSDVICYKKRQLNKNEIKKLKLRSK